VPIYAFEARNDLGALVRGRESALDERELDRALAERRLFLVKARAAERRSRSRRASTRTLIDLCQHLGTALEAGIPLLHALRDLQEQGQSPIASELEDLARKVESGQRLSEAMTTHRGLFPELLRSLVAAGEETGALDRILRDLVSYLEWREELRRKIVGSATYPCLVLLGLVGLCVLLCTVVLPRFLELFLELDVELALATRVLIAVQGFVSAYWAWTLVALALSALAWRLWTSTSAGRLWWHRTILRLPILGGVVSMVEMSRLAHNLGLVYSAGIPILRALDLVESIVRNQAVARIVSRAREQVQAGESLTAAFGSSTLLPAMVRRMISLGESSGRLGESLEHVSRYYEREVPVRIDTALTFFNTGAVVALGAVLGTIAFAVFVPLYRMMGNLGA
jgi:type IV pilus assembly protein PilC